MEWRVVPLQQMNAYAAMALDEACTEYVQAGGPPTIRFWTWEPSAVSIGYFQSLHDEVDVNKCRELGVDVVRRRTGGGAVYHDKMGEITYSVICPEHFIAKGITESYHIICDWIVKGLWEMGIESEFKPINDILAGGRKISGNAQTRRGGVLHQHGTVLHDLDVETMFSLLKVSDEKISDKFLESVRERVTCVKDFREVSQKASYYNILKGFTDGKQWKFGDWTPQERARAEQLAKERYSTHEWNALR